MLLRGLRCSGAKNSTINSSPGRKRKLPEALSRTACCMSSSRYCCRTFVTTCCPNTIWKFRAMIRLWSLKKSSGCEAREFLNISVFQTFRKRWRLTTPRESTPLGQLGGRANQKVDKRKTRPSPVILKIANSLRKGHLRIAVIQRESRIEAFQWRICDPHHTLDNSLLNVPIGLSIGWGMKNCKSIPIVTCNRRVQMSIDTCFFNQEVQRNWYNRLMFLG